ncbi:retrotransposon protein putative ty3-gypsy sub-class [Cucumis melo var. makuwa]|uniref:Retrotransposon protein putative ty3-gypsy sub-class n=1 Tax=Cucumis melo var. makuwa TaxID=1194695 RepID=A0A5D3BCK9_CUCMM|nr:retrotransposon protein putative ty3-gypsy sub-class [Cucumis melo var. makuwa]TYJ96857.1 retrotransposon protein putative ty3-gypsy sub-class [Cucumis melo var. makuwa]
MTFQGNTSKSLSDIGKRPNIIAAQGRFNHLKICHPLKSQRIFRSKSSGHKKQLQKMTANSIKTQYDGSAQTFFLYSKPYTKRIDNMRMPHGYQPLKFQQFDGKGNTKQHVAHFIETCETAGT